MNTAKKTYTEIEKIIKTRLAALAEDYDLDRFDIAALRDETYREFGWRFDPFPEEEEEEDGTEIYEPYRYERDIETGWAFF